MARQGDTATPAPPAMPADNTSGVRLATGDAAATLPSQRAPRVVAAGRDGLPDDWPGDRVGPRIRCADCEAWRLTAENERHRAGWLEGVVAQVHAENARLLEENEALADAREAESKTIDLLRDCIGRLWRGER